MHNLIIYGGTFDPIHYGHINTALQVQKQFGFERFYFLPCKTPVLKAESQASADDRIHMVQLALEDMPAELHFDWDDSEIKRTTPSYMVTTLKHFREKLGTTIPITLLLGYDSFIQLPFWHQWQHLLDLCNLLVINREAFSKHPLPESLQALLKKHEHNDKNILLKQSHGVIHRFNAGNFDISSSQLRQKLALQDDLCNNIPDNVIAYIKKHKLYGMQ